MHAEELNFCFTGKPDQLQEWFAVGIKGEMLARGHRFHDKPSPHTHLAINFAGIDEPNPVLPELPNDRTRVITIVRGEKRPVDVMETAYPLLVRNLCTVLLLLVGSPRRLETSYMVTLEQGHPEIPYEGGEGGYFAEVYERLRPRFSATWAFDNIFRPDLPKELWGGTTITQQITMAGILLKSLGLLPPPFPFENYLSPDQIRFVRLAYKLFGLSYGNVSARAMHESLDGVNFWMSVSGVDKSKLVEIGEHIQLVAGISGNSVVVRIPPGKPHRRVSVDAIEHHMIYAENPAVGALLHFHGWPTKVSEGLTMIRTSPYEAYPCGSLDMARATARTVKEALNPIGLVIGQANHGTVVTGPNLATIFLWLAGGQIEFSHQIPQV